MLQYKDLEEKIKSLEAKYDTNFQQVFRALELLLKNNQNRETFKERRRIGYKIKSV
jgi:hypothetical protein